jgi:glutamine synthetase
VLKDLMERHGDVIFGGDGYSEEWHRIAVDERGLRNLPTAADALPVLQEQAVIDLLERTNVMSAAELQSRYEVYSEQYIMSIGVESRLMAEMAKTTVYPAAMAYLADITSTISAAAQAGVEIEPTVAKTVAEQANALMSSAARLGTAVAVDHFDSPAEQMRYCVTTLLPLMAEVRSHADALEAEVADSYWPLPKYREMLFIK